MKSKVKKKVKPRSAKTPMSFEETLARIVRVRPKPLNKLVKRAK